ncbi:pyrokinin-1 receptor-like isoform X2, partial [Aphis craccivora]
MSSAYTSLSKSILVCFVCFYQNMVELRDFIERFCRIETNHLDLQTALLRSLFHTINNAISIIIDVYRVSGFKYSYGNNYSSHDDHQWGPRRDSLPVVVPVTLIYTLIFATGIVGNVSTCIVIARNKYMHTATNYYLFSLAVSDLLLLLSGLPQEIYLTWSRYPYVFGEMFCIVRGFAAETSTNATVLTITAFTIERYVAICHPFLSHTESNLSRAFKYILIIWVVALTLAFPQAIQMGLVYARTQDGAIIPELSTCGLANKLPYAFELSSVLFFLAPWTLIIVLYILIGLKLYKSKRDSSRTTCSAHCRHTACLSSTNTRATGRVVKML